MSIPVTNELSRGLVIYAFTHKCYPKMLSLAHSIKPRPVVPCLQQSSLNNPVNIQQLEGDLKEGCYRALRCQLNEHCHGKSIGALGY